MIVEWTRWHDGPFGNIEESFPTTHRGEVVGTGRTLLQGATFIVKTRYGFEEILVAHAREVPTAAEAAKERRP